MAVNDKLTRNFLQALLEIESVLFTLSFIKYSLVKKGDAVYSQFKKSDTVVEFLFGAPEFQIEMIIYTTKGKFAFKDLLQIPTIAKWVNNNRYVQLNERKIKDEVLWFIELMKVSLIEIE